MQLDADAPWRYKQLGGKRLRPAFFHWAHVGAGGEPFAPEAVNAAAAIEMLHAFALAHDDIMDASASRRGNPTVHVRFAELHRHEGWQEISALHGALRDLTGHEAPAPTPLRESWQPSIDAWVAYLEAQGQ